MRHSDLSLLLPTMIKAGIIPHLEGAPGTGKTEKVYEVAQTLDADVIFIHAATRNPEDLAVPNMAPAAGVFSEWHDPNTMLSYRVNGAEIPVEGSQWDDPARDPERLILVMVDELAQADTPFQKTLGNVFLAREFYGRKVLPCVRFMSTGNRVEDRAGARKLLTHLADRVVILEVDFNIDDFHDWLLNNQIHPILRAFAKFAPKEIYSFEPDRKVNATPRGWVQKVAPLLDAGLPIHLLFEACKGAVGEGPATIFQTFVKMASHLNFDAMLADPDKYPLPTESSTLYIIASTLAMRANVKNFDAIMRIAGRIPDEFGVLVVLEASKIEPRVMSTPAYAAWAQGPGAKVLGIK